MELREVKQDLFNVGDKYALAHCISQDCAMGAGIAKEFVKRFPDMKPSLIDYITRLGIKCPDTLLYNKPTYGRCIFNLITKEKYWHKPTYQAMISCVREMCRLCIKYEIEYLAMPFIGCGLDRLKWDKVKAIIEDAFKDSNVKEILVCKL